MVFEGTQGELECHRRGGEDGEASKFSGIRGEYIHSNCLPVPLGGNRIPEGMEGDVEDWHNLPVDNYIEAPSFGAAYDSLLNFRTAIGNLKKAVAQLAIPVEGVMKAKLFLAKPAIQNDAHKARKFQRLLDDKLKARDIAIQQVRDELDVVISVASARVYDDREDWSPQAEEDMIARISAVVEEACELSVLDLQNKEEYTDFGLNLQGLTRKLFAEHNLLLERLKVLKAQ